MRWTLKEFIYEMEQDTQRHVFFVEGITDQSFWTVTLNPLRKTGAVVYSISSVECSPVSGGERGRMMWLAARLSSSPIAHRLFYFADADWDRLLQVPLSTNVMLTDGRDLESYFQLGNCCLHLCASLAASAPDIANSSLSGLLTSVLRPLGVLRLTSARNNLDLPFQKTLDGGLARFIDASSELDERKMLETLLQNADRSLAEFGHIQSLFQAEVTANVSVPNYQLVHGKDLSKLIAWKFKISSSFAEKFLTMALMAEKDAILAEPNIRHASAWLK
jgi:hypothetical protein